MPQPEDHRRHEETRVLQRVHAFVAQGGFEQQWNVPQPHDQAVEENNQQRSAHHAPEVSEAGRGEDAHHASASFVTKRPGKGHYRPTQDDQRRSYHQQDFMLRHVRGKQ